MQSPSIVPFPFAECAWNREFTASSHDTAVFFRNPPNKKKAVS
jgi:hypothetical protein